ncbi:hypothetical protein CTheo_8383 [Ceratobasidium theobromae]|uniref:CxC2-like cysteine cluster KDZ transposase-associated domain-containing protein n=1 Tax=Ceratobasidium theobromae TaxID=1582974 RepID=A0A5N5Q8X5_9AGAM|nr:hypothetical protein CTheo_8383 [Ceratobasidium theobromae]
MPKRKQETQSVFHTPVVSSHYASGQHGKIISTKRKNTTLVPNVYPAAVRTPHHDGVNPAFSFEFDDAGYADSVERESMQQEALVKALALLLLRAGLMPCTDAERRSAFTLALLDHCAVFSTLAKTSSYRYYSVLKHLTHTGFPGQVSDRYHEFLQAQRKYSYLMALKHSGTAFDTEQGDLDTGSLAIDCVACPKPGVNFNLADVLPAERPFFRFWFSFDGNFHNPRKAKKFDAGDLCFTDGRMYYVEQAPYRDWINSKDNKEPSMDKKRPECDNHKAATDKFVRWGGLDVTGVGACTCARHSLFQPQGFVDFYKGERFAYGDYAIASTITQILQSGEAEFGMTYNIWCHWEPKFSDRAANFPSHIALPKNFQLIGGVPKFHGEGCEHAWAFLNDTAGSTSEKSPGFRWDLINFIILDWNFEKTITISVFLVTKFCEAVTGYHTQKAIFDDLDQSLGHMTATWRKESIEPVKQADGKWSSPFFGSCDWGQELQEVLRQEQEHEDVEDMEVNSRTGKHGLTKWISQAIELENTMDKLKQDAELLTPNSTPRQHNLINDRRKTLLKCVDVHRQERERYLASLGDPDHPDRQFHDTLDPEYAELGLLSSYRASSLIDGGCLQAPRVEGRLRRAVCGDALQMVRSLLGAKSLALKYKRRNVVGEIATTRVEMALRDLQTKIRCAHCRYNRSHDALIRLDLLAADHTTYLELKSEHLQMLSDYIDNTSVELGQKKVEVAWIWRTCAAPNDQQWHQDALKVEWFRAWQRYIQWEEELKILK